MKRPIFDPAWPESWKQSFYYDRMEVFGEIPQGRHGYAFAYQARADNTIDLVRSALPPGARVLDVAAAQGNFTLRLAEAGYEVTWNDLRGELIDYVKLKWEKGIVHFRPGNILNSDDNLGQFDGVLIAEIIEHVAHPDQFLRRIASLVKPGGVVVMTTPNGGYFRNRLPKFSECPDPSLFEKNQFKPDSDGHIFLLHEDEVYRLADQSGLHVSELRIITNPLTHGHLKASTLIPYLPLRWVKTAEELTGRLPVFVRKKLHTQFVTLLQRELG